VTYYGIAITYLHTNEELLRYISRKWRKHERKVGANC